MPKQRISRNAGRRVIGVLSGLAPEHFGDFFSAFLLAALAGGAALFLFFAWIPSSEVPQQHVPGAIPIFSEEELRAVVAILEARIEASTAPVVPPDRDPFK